MALISDEGHALLVQSALVALDGGAVNKAEQILEAARLERPSAARTYVGLAVAKFAQKDFKGAVALLRDQGLKANPKADILKAYLGFALLKSGASDEGKKTLNDVISSSSDKDVVEFAKAAAEEA